MRAYMIKDTVLAIKLFDAACFCFPKRTLIELAIPGGKLEQDIVCRLAFVCAFPSRTQDVEEGTSEMELIVKGKVVAHLSVVRLGDGGWAVRGSVHFLSSRWVVCLLCMNVRLLLLLLMRGHGGRKMLCLRGVCLNLVNTRV